MTFHAAVACIVALGLTAGGVRTWTVPCLALVAVLACAQVVYRRSFRLAPLHLLLLAAAIWQTALVIPLPPALLHALSPAYAETRAFVLGELWGPCATNPAITALDAARLWATLLLVCVVADQAHRNQPTRLVALAIVGTGLAQMLVGGFVNPNHQAAFWNVGWIVALCSTFVARTQWMRAALSVASAALLVGVATTGSRAGVACAAIGGVVLGWRLRHDMGRRAGVIAFFLSLALIIGAGLAGDRVVSELRLRAEEKTRVWDSALSLVNNAPFGYGRGGFGLVFPSVREPDKERGRWDYVENEYIQTLLDYGPLGGALGLLGLVWLARSLVRKTRWRVETAGMSAIVAALAAHAVFDFNWELAGVFLPVWLLIATLARPNNHAFAPAAFDKSGVPVRAVFVLAVLALPPLVAFGVHNDPQTLDAEALVRTRPLDSWAHTVLATRAMHDNKPEQALASLNCAVYVDRDWKAPHIALARLFCASGNRAQGRVELKLAEDRSGDDGRDPAALPLLLRCIDAPGDELDIGEHALPAVIAELQRERRQESLDAIETLYDGHDPAVLRAFKLLRAEKSQDLALFAEIYAEDHSIAPRYVDLLIGRGLFAEASAVNEQQSGREHELNRARILAKTHKPNEALGVYRLWVTRSPRDVPAVLEAARYALQLGDKQVAADILNLSMRAEPNAEVQALLRETSK